MRLTRRRVAALGAGLLLVTACTGDDEPDPDPPPIGGGENEVEPNGEEEPDDEEPYAVPDEIDEEYAEQVINVLLEVNSEALRIVLEQEPGEVIDPGAVDRLHAIAAGGRLEFLMETYQLYIDDPELADGFLPTEELGTSRFESHGILHAEPENCILAVGWWDRTEVATDPPDDDSLFSLSPLDREETSIDRNPTPWQVREIGPMVIDDDPIPEDRWDEIDFGDALDRTCEDR